jgi:hypothetical protein
MDLKILPSHVDGEILYHVVEACVPQPGEPPAVLFTGLSWAEAEQYIGDVGGG